MNSLLRGKDTNFHRNFQKKIFAKSMQMHGACLQNVYKDYYALKII